MVFTFENVAYVPSMHTNLALARLFKRAGIFYNMEDDCLYYKDSG